MGSPAVTTHACQNRWGSLSFFLDRHCRVWANDRLQLVRSIPVEAYDFVASFRMVRQFGRRRGDPRFDVAVSRDRGFSSFGFSHHRRSRFAGRPATAWSRIAESNSQPNCKRCPTVADWKSGGDADLRNPALYVRSGQMLLPRSLLGKDDLALPRDHLYVHHSAEGNHGGPWPRGAALEQNSGRRVGRIVVRRGHRRPVDWLFLTRPN